MSFIRLFSSDLFCEINNLLVHLYLTMVMSIDYCKCRRFYACNSKYVIDAAWGKGDVVFSVTSFDAIFAKISKSLILTYVEKDINASCVQNGLLVWEWRESWACTENKCIQNERPPILWHVHADQSVTIRNTAMFTSGTLVFLFLTSCVSMYFLLKILKRPVLVRTTHSQKIRVRMRSKKKFDKLNSQ